MLFICFLKMYRLIFGLNCTKLNPATKTAGSLLSFGYAKHISTTQGTYLIYIHLNQWGLGKTLIKWFCTNYINIHSAIETMPLFHAMYNTYILMSNKSTSWNSTWITQNNTIVYYTRRYSTSPGSKMRGWWCWGVTVTPTPSTSSPARSWLPSPHAQAIYYNFRIVPTKSK